MTMSRTMSLRSDQSTTWRLNFIGSDMGEIACLGASVSVEPRNDPYRVDADGCEYPLQRRLGQADVTAALYAACSSTFHAGSCMRLRARR